MLCGVTDQTDPSYPFFYFILFYFIIYFFSFCNNNNNNKSNNNSNNNKDIITVERVLRVDVKTRGPNPNSF